MGRSAGKTVKIKVRRLSYYLAVLEKADLEYVAETDVAFTLAKKTTVHLVLTHPKARTPEGRRQAVTHEIIHQAHGLEARPDPEENDAQETDIDRVAGELLNHPEWQAAVTSWLEREQNRCLRETISEQFNGGIPGGDAAHEG